MPRLAAACLIGCAAYAFDISTVHLLEFGCILSLHHCEVICRLFAKVLRSALDCAVFDDGIVFIFIIC